MIRAVVALAVLAACGDKQPPPPPVAQPAPPAPPTAADAAAAAAASPIPATTRQLVTGVVDDWSATRAKLQLWTRSAADAPWSPVGAAWDAVVGTRGIAWGRGLHTATLEPVKREGDGKAPAGAFQLRGAYGYAAAPPRGTQLPYTPAGALECVDDPRSSHYTQIVERAGTADWTSSERMRRKDALYTWVIDIAHNPARTPGDGSCIFFHVWGGPDDATVGCTAMAEDRLVALLTQLDPAAVPVYVLLPRSEYEAFAPAWNLPPL